MILSVSRRTDIPNYYSEWFINRMKEGFLYVRNPMNIHQVSKIMLSPDIVDCIVFWTKNPKPMLDKLDALKEYKYYFQFTLTGYGRDVEKGLPHKKKEVIPVFKELSKKIGSEKVIWRYDPIFFNENYTKEYHINAFSQIAEELEGYTHRCVISFVDFYAKNRKGMEELKLQETKERQLVSFSGKLQEVALAKGIEVFSCAEKIDLSECGIKHGSCIDKNIIEEITGCKIEASKDKNQREECGCVESVDVGSYNTCLNGCKYCYANFSEKAVCSNVKKCDVNSPLLCGNVEDIDKITERKMKSLKIQQISLFDL
ncbi:MAG: DUF1848 domain-containing protein [Lachnospiraceae bacterium]|nr:DUF1848 domain-containing protein [Lachnospiraceae bacterium]